MDRSLSAPLALSDLAPPPKQRPRLALLALLMLCVLGMEPVLYTVGLVLGVTLGLTALDSLRRCALRRANVVRLCQESEDDAYAVREQQEAATRAHYLLGFATGPLCVHEHCDACNTSFVAGYEWAPAPCVCPRAEATPRRREPCRCPPATYVFFCDAVDGPARRERAPCKKCLVCGSKTDMHARVYADRPAPLSSSVFLAAARHFAGRTRYLEAVVDC